MSIRRGTMALSLLLSLGLTAAGFAASKKRIHSTVGKKPPRRALILFDGKDTSAWRSRGSNKPAPWQIKDGYMQVRGGDIVTKQKFRDFKLHVEFWLPLMADKHGQARANSGVYLQGRYEVQVLDSYGLKSKKNDCGAIYGYYAPRVNACAKPQIWQTYDITFRTPRYDALGRRTYAGRITVYQNGILIQNKVKVPGPTRSGMKGELAQPGPILLQDHGNPIRYRNIWLVEK